MARKPKCPECPILELCEFREKTRSEPAKQQPELNLKIKKR